MRPVELSDINKWYVLLTSDTTEYTPKDVFFGHKHAEARKQAAIEFLDLELNMDKHEFNVLRADYHGDESRMSLIATLENKRQVTKCFIKHAGIRTEGISVQNHWPQISFQRRRELFMWMKDAKARTGNQYQLRLGTSDVEMFVKEPGGYYTPIPLVFFFEEAGKRLEDLPGLYKKREVARGRKNARPNSSPVHSEEREARRFRTEATDPVGLSVEAGTPGTMVMPVVSSVDSLSSGGTPTEGASSATDSSISSDTSDSSVTGERNDSGNVEDGVQS